MNRLRSFAMPPSACLAAFHLHIVAAYVFGLDEREEDGDELRLILEWEF